MDGIVEKIKFYKKYIQIHEKSLSRYVATAVSGAISDKMVMQRIMERAFHDIEQIDVKSGVRQWLYKIASEEIIKAFIAEKGNTALQYGVKDRSVSEHEITMWIEREIEIATYQRRLGIEYIDIFSKLKQMHFEDRLPVLMRYMAGLGRSEIANLMDFSAKELDETMRKSLVMVMRHFDGFPEDAVAMMDLEQFENSESAEPAETIRDRDAIRLKIAQEYRENPKVLYMEDIIAQRGKKEFNQFESALIDRVDAWVAEGTLQCDLPPVDFSFVELEQQGKTSKESTIVVNFAKQMKEDVVKYDLVAQDVDDESYDEIERALNRKAKESESCNEKDK